MDDEPRKANVERTADVVSAFLSNNAVPAGDIAGLIEKVHTALMDAERKGDEPPRESKEPAVPIKKSVQPDYIVCLECGKPFKQLKRHIRTFHDLTPDDYRARWGLPYDYPMVAPNYAAQRSQLAKDIGLGQKPTRKKSGSSNSRRRAK